jgi:CRISPR-associated protein Cas2
MATRYLISYDITDEKRLREVHKVVRASARRVQDSVYEALLTDTERVRLETRLKSVMNLKEDQVLFIALGDAELKVVPSVNALGLPWTPTTRGPIVW